MHVLKLQASEGKSQMWASERLFVMFLICTLIFYFRTFTEFSEGQYRPFFVNDRICSYFLTVYRLTDITESQFSSTSVKSDDFPLQLCKFVSMHREVRHDKSPS